MNNNIRKPDHPMDWVMIIASAFCVCLGLYILFQPEVLYFTVLHVGTFAKVMFWWFIAAIVTMVIYNLVKHSVANDTNRNRTHGRSRK